MEAVMSISSVGASGFGNPSQILARMLTRLDNTQSPATDRTSRISGNAASAAFASHGNDAGNALTGTDPSKLSDRILAVLVELQQQSSAGDSQPGGADDAAAAPASPIGNPIQQLFSAMDGDGDGGINQSEMETYIQAHGGTQNQADELFSALDRNDSGSLSETQLAGDVAPGHRAYHSHHHPEEAPQTNSDDSSSPDDPASQISGALDGDQDETSAGSDTAAMNTLMQRAAQAYGSAANMFDPASLMPSGTA
jgi:hypothetical protein